MLILTEFIPYDVLYWVDGAAKAFSWEMDTLAM
jgi:hypothetical protein